MITGNDVIDAIKNKEIQHLVIPSVMLKKNGENYEEIFLDEITINDVKISNKNSKIHILKDCYSFDEIRKLINSL